VRDYQIWWALFVFFAALSVLVVQRRYQRWRRARHLSQEVDPRVPREMNRRIRLEGWRLILMTVSLLAMSGAVVTVFWPGPPALLEVFRQVALLAVMGVLLLSLRL
jgi:fatty acid desaturase